MYDVISNIIKYGVYFILLLATINIIQPNIYKSIKDNIINTLNGDYQLFSNIALYIKNLLKPNKKYRYDK
jgi:cobyric acid synthase